jgi:hypothetical protein
MERRGNCTTKISLLTLIFFVFWTRLLAVGQILLRCIFEMNNDFIPDWLVTYILYKAIISNVHEQMNGEMYEKYYFNVILTVHRR